MNAFKAEEVVFDDDEYDKAIAVWEGAVDLKLM